MEVGRVKEKTTKGEKKLNRRRVSKCATVHTMRKQVDETFIKSFRLSGISYMPTRIRTISKVSHLPAPSSLASPRCHTIWPAMSKRKQFLARFSTFIPSTRLDPQFSTTNVTHPVHRPLTQSFRHIRLLWYRGKLTKLTIRKLAVV